MKLAAGRARQVLGFFLPFRRLVFSFVSFHPQPSEVLSVQQFMSRDSGGKVTSKPAGCGFYQSPAAFVSSRSLSCSAQKLVRSFFFFPVDAGMMSYEQETKRISIVRSNA